MRNHSTKLEHTKGLNKNLVVIFTILSLLSPPGFVPVCSGETKVAGIQKYDNTNVILISIDTLRYDHLGCYGYPKNTSENIDGFAKEAVLFDNFIAQAVLTPISQMSILTSQYPRVNGMASFEAAMDTVTEKSLPQILKYYGYTNAAFLGSPEFYRSGMVRNFSDSDNHKQLFGKYFDIYIPPKGRKIPQDALKWIESNKEKKFFLWLPIGTVHWPYSINVPLPYKSRFDPKNYTPFFNGIQKGDKNAVQSDAVSSGVLSRIYRNYYYADSVSPYHLSEKDIQFIISRYDAGIYYTDLFIGKLLSLLEKLNLSSNTVIVLHSVHGEDLGEHGYFYHYDLYDTEVKNVFIIRFPGNEFGGKRISSQTQGIDIMPTLLDYLDIPINHEAQGISFMPYIESSRSEEINEYTYTIRTPLWEYLLFRKKDKVTPYTRTFKATSPLENQKLLLYYEKIQKYLDRYDPQYPPYDIAIRTNDWKLILRRDKFLLENISWWSFVSGKKIEIDEIELYDLKKDPFEQKNISSQRPDIVAKLKGKLLEWDTLMEKLKPRSDKNAERYYIPYP